MPKEANRRPKRRLLRGACLLLLGAALIGSLPRPMWIDVTVPESSEAVANGRLAFRSARRLVELSGKGTAADDTELSGPCFSNDGQTLYFTRARPGQRADIVRSRLSGSRWSRPEPVRELNSVDDDRRVTIGADSRSLIVASNRSGTRGGLDLWESSGTSGRWSRPKNVSVAINTSAEEFDPALSPDGLMLLFARRSAGGRSELFVSHRTQVSAAWSASQPVTSANSYYGDKLSPMFAPDGRSVWFVVQRLGSNGEVSVSELFRSPLANGLIGTAAPVRDAIATTGSISEIALSADGRSLIFVSQRDGGLRLYQSQADWVVSRLSVSTAHLDRFSRAKWGVPIGLAIGLFMVARMTRRTNSTAPSPALTISKRAQQTAPDEVNGVAGPVRRNAPPVNPLDKWKTLPPETQTPITPRIPGEPEGVRPRTGVTVRDLTPSGSPAVGNRVGNRRRRIAGLLSLAALVLIGFWSRDRWLQPTGTFVSSDWSQFHQFRDIAATTRETLPIVARAATARVTAPDPHGITIESATLRQSARWPVELVVIRTPAPLFVAPPATPELTGIAKVTPFARAVTRGPIGRADRGFVELIPIEAVVLTAAEPALEKPLAVSILDTARRLSDLPIKSVLNLTSVGWPTGMQSPTKLYLAPNELVPIQPPTISTSLVSQNRFDANRGSSTIAAPADVDPGQPLPQPLNDQTIVVGLSPLPRSAVDDSVPVPSTPPIRSSNPAVELRATTTDTSVNRDSPSIASNGLTPQSLAVERRAPREVTAITASPDVGSNPAGQAEPTILLTSAQTMTELFPAAPISPLNRVDILASAAKPAELPPISLATWFRQLLMPPTANDARAETITTSSQPTMALPLRVKDTTASAIPETAVPIFE